MKIRVVKGSSCKGRIKRLWMLLVGFGFYHNEHACTDQHMIMDRYTHGIWTLHLNRYGMFVCNLTPTRTIIPKRILGASYENKEFSELHMKTIFKVLELPLYISSMKIKRGWWFQMRNLPNLVVLVTLLQGFIEEASTSSNATHEELLLTKWS